MDETFFIKSSRPEGEHGREHNQTCRTQGTDVRNVESPGDFVGKNGRQSCDRCKQDDENRQSRHLLGHLLHDELFIQTVVGIADIYQKS